MQETVDFENECKALEAILIKLEDPDYNAETQFKTWTIFDILAHLHLWNMAAIWTLNETYKFEQLMVEVMKVFQGGQTHQKLQKEWCQTLKLNSGECLFAAWQEGYKQVVQNYLNADPLRRVKWGGPDMSVKSCIIARQMETWAHSQAIFDVLGIDRINSESLKNIAHIGVITYSWSFKIKELIPPSPKPYVKLISPNGKIWEWNEPQDNNKITGNAEEFCQVVTQCRNIKDTNLECIGSIASTWMTIAQCFAGVSEVPPAKGTRIKIIN